MSMAEIARTSLANEPLALTALDGRYRSAVAPLVDYLSEAALNRDRVHVEVEWLIHLTDNSVLPGTSPLIAEQKTALRKIVTDFDADSVKELAEIEAVTVHDVEGSGVLHRQPLGSDRHWKPQAAGALRLHLRRHQQPLLRSGRPGWRTAGMAAGRPRSGGPADQDGRGFP